MGSYLSVPVTSKESHAVESDAYAVGVSCMQGWRRTMEDAHIVNLDIDGQGTALYGVFDGHGGAEVARYVAKHLQEQIVGSDKYKEGEFGAALTDAFLRMDQVLVTPHAMEELRALENSDTSDDEGGADMSRVLMQQLQGGDGEGEGGEGDAAGGLRSLLAAGAGEEGEGGDTETLIQAVPGPNGTLQFMLIRRPKAGGAAAREAAEAMEDEDASDDEETTPTASAPPPDSDPSGEMVVRPEAEASPGAAGANSYMAAGHAEDQAFLSDTPEFSGPHSGCTAIVALVRGRRLYVANAGDSRCLLSRNGVAVAMSHDHKPTDEPELARITRAGGQVFDGRVNGSLNLSRAIGDLEYKQNKELPASDQMVTALPEIRTVDLQEGDEFLLLACDGIYDVMENQQAVDFIRPRLMQGMRPEEICEELCDHCLAPDTSSQMGRGCDNMSALIVVLKGTAGFSKAK